MSKRLGVAIFLLSSVFFYAASQNILIVMSPLSVSSNSYPQEENVSFIVREGIFRRLAVIPGWRVEKDENKKGFRLETSMRFEGSIAKPVIYWEFQLFNEKNKMVYITNLESDAKYGLFDMMDVAAEGISRFLGKSLSEKGVLVFTVPRGVVIEGKVTLQGNVIAHITNDEEIEERLEIVSGETYELKLENSYGQVLDRCLIEVQRGEEKRVVLLPSYELKVYPLRNNFIFLDMRQYQYSIRSHPGSSFMTNIEVGFTNQSESLDFVLPAGQIYVFDLYTVSNENRYHLSSTTFSLSSSVHYQPLDMVFSRAGYVNTRVVLRDGQHVEVVVSPGLFYGDKRKNFFEFGFGVGFGGEDVFVETGMRFGGAFVRAFSEWWRISSVLEARYRDVFGGNQGELVGAFGVENSVGPWFICVAANGVITFQNFGWHIGWEISSGWRW